MIAEPVSTNIGIVPEEDLEIQLAKSDDGNSWSITRTYVYKGSLFPQARGQVVRRDVWVTMKNGLGAISASGA